MLECYCKRDPVTVHKAITKKSHSCEWIIYSNIKACNSSIESNTCCKSLNFLFCCISAKWFFSEKEFFNLPIDKAINVVKIITEQFEKLSQDVATELDKEGWFSGENRVADQVVSRDNITETWWDDEEIE